VSEFLCYDGDVIVRNRTYHNQQGEERNMIYTARGTIHKSELGVTLGHEHIKWESDEYQANNMYFDKKYNEEDIHLDLKYIMPILLDIKAKGGKSVVEASPPIGGQNVRLLKELSERADMHIIPCTGWNLTKQLYDVFTVRRTTGKPLDQRLQRRLGYYRWNCYTPGAH